MYGPPTAAQAAAQGFLERINEAILFPLIVLLMALALFYFLWGAFQYVRNAANDVKRQEGQRHLLWGIIGMLVMLSAFAILTIAANTFGLGSQVQEAPNPLLPPPLTGTMRPEPRPSGASPAPADPTIPSDPTTPTLPTFPTRP